MEQRPSAHITARIHSEVYAEAQRYAERRAVTFSQAIRELLFRGLMHAAADPDDEWTFAGAELETLREDSQS